MQFCNDIEQSEIVLHLNELPISQFVVASPRMAKPHKIKPKNDEVIL